MGRSQYDPGYDNRTPWNAGRLVGAKRAFKVKQIWAIRFHLEHERRLRERALLDLAIDSKLRGCDLVKLKIGDIVSRGKMRPRAIVVQQKTGNRFSSRSWNLCALRSWHGWSVGAARWMISSFPADAIRGGT